MNLLVFILTMLGGRAHIVNVDQPTGDLTHGDVLIVVGGDRCDSGWSFEADGTTWCVGVDF